MSKLSDEIDAKAPAKVTPTKENPYIRPKHREIFERMKQGETITGAMIAMSYKPSVVDNPHLVTKSKSWQALMEEQLPEDHVALRHREILDKRAYRYVTKGKGKNRTEERVDDGPDPMVMRGVELAYKLRGRMVSDTPPPDRPNVYNLFYQPNIRASVKTFEDTLKQAIAHEVTRQDTPMDSDGTVTRTADGDGSVDAGTVEEVGRPEGGGDVRAD